MSRYIRNEQVVGKDGQKKLNDSSVLIIGCGALGSPAAMYLAGAGVGRIGLVDFDTIDTTNLQRQLFYKEIEAGCLKSEILAKRIYDLNSEIEVVTFPMLFNSKNGPKIVDSFDIIIEATDNPSSKYLIAEICEKSGKPVVIGGVAGMRGQVTTYLPGHMRFSDFFPIPPEEQGVLPCAMEGVIGPAAGLISSIQATETIKYLSGTGSLLTDKLLVVDISANTFLTIV